MIEQIYSLLPPFVWEILWAVVKAVIILLGVVISAAWMIWL